MKSLETGSRKTADRGRQPGFAGPAARAEGGPPRRASGRFGNRGSNAFTLVEMLVVVGMLGILMGVAFSGIGQARNRARVVKANTELRQLIGAWLAYEAAYDDWPVQMTGDEVEATAGTLSELLGDNAEKTVYLDAQMVNGAFRDPWGTPYRFRLLAQKSTSSAAVRFGATVTFPNRHRPASPNSGK